MHERTTRAIARWLFVGCCAAPTALTMLAILVTWTPWYHARARRAIESQVALMTGLRVEIGDFERADPSTWRLSEVRLSDPETLQPVVSVRSLQWISQSENTVIRLSQPEIRVESLEQVAGLVHSRFICRPDQTRVPVRIAADDVTLRGSSTAQTIQDFDAWLETRDDVVWATVRCIPAGYRPDSDGVHLEVTRDRSTSPPTTSWSMQTGEVQLPLAVLSDYYPFLSRLGDEAMFDGSVSGTRQDGLTRPAWTLNLAGHFREIDLGQLTQSLPHRVTGKGTVSVDRCQLDQDWSVNVAGQLAAEEGWMSASLLPRLAEDLGCELTVNTDQDFGFDALALRFDLYAAQLRVEGVCRSLPGREWLPADVVVSAGGRPIVMSSGNWTDSLNLARLIAPSHSVWIPLSGQTSGLLSILRPPSHPLPQNGAGQRAQGADAVASEVSEPAARIGRLQPRRDETSPISQPR
ncbi:hypothetical protein [Allorhodopirellula solitaria]|uniref:AsmA-like C-terminal domain-containing protein n=1 Tax=Allorhodopirellula solitaria TaxID=2527987 RepID=A0A5C5YJW1_9BACT|nr:hypothetical protein [Allorhodopirellula solitaria]TWT75184.1 hypothetical protein CA85_04730 [Allorhodopirellula solitaria]